MHITVLGAGLVGSAIVKDLAKGADHDITAVDLNRQALNKLETETPVKCVEANLQQAGSIAPLVADSDLVICAVPGFMGFETLRKVIGAGKSVVDISFFEEDPFRLDDLAKAQGVTAVVDCGVAPGLSNIIVGHVANLLDQTDRFVCYVGGLPQVRQWPYEYKVVFSPSDLLEEYTRPCRLIEHGQEVVRPALSEVEFLNFPNVGTLEAFNTDGLRSLRQTMNIPFMKEKTLRYPGHANLMRIFRESGFFGTTPVEVNGHMIQPITLTSKLLFDQWQLKEGDEDLTVMQVVIEGRKDSKKVRYTYDLLDTYDRKTQTTSMARTTGYTCSVVARQIAKGLFTAEGICPPEFIGRTGGCYENLLAEYATRNIRLTETVTEQ
jgi:saccharopine dehydrogenase-like NADP-dependent oxidoreductase